MKHWGLGSGPLEARVAHEVHYLLSSISNEGTNPIDPAPILNCAISNVICSSLMSTRFHHKDEKFRRFMHLFDEGFRLFQSLESLPSIPFLRHLPPVLNPQSSVLKKLKTNREEMLEFVSLIIQDHKESLDTASPRDLVDSYLIEMLEDRAEVCGPDPERQLEQVILDIFSAGVETLKTSLQWAILFMIHHPEVRRRVQEEIGGVVAGDLLPGKDDMPELPYTRATIREVMRRVTVVPLGTTHATTRLV